MAELTSRLFTEADPATVAKLENCATGTPNEFSSHFSLTENTSGEHVRRVQLALKHAQEVDSSLDLPPFDVNGVYDKRFADAIAAYKEARGIKNFAGRIDNIVGLKTIRSLDADGRIHNQVEPDRPHKDKPVPRPTPPTIPTNCVVDAECPTNTVFDIQLIVGGSGGEGIEGGFFTFTITDLENRLSCIYTLTSGGLGTPGLPVSPAGGGNPSRFRTPPVKVTRFGPIGTLTSVTIGPPTGGFDPNNVQLVSILRFGYRTGSSNTPDGLVTIHDFDTGPINLQGLDFQGGRFQCVGTCKGGLGASKI